MLKAITLTVEEVRQDVLDLLKETKDKPTLAILGKYKRYLEDKEAVSFDAMTGKLQIQLKAILFRISV